MKSPSTRFKKSKVELNKILFLSHDLKLIFVEIPLFDKTI